MIKKITLFSLLSALACSSAIDAHAMCNHCSSVFFSLEGAYSRLAIDNYEFDILGTADTLVSNKQNSSGGGRLAAGVMRWLCDEWGVSAEIGWGFYGRTKLNPVSTGVFATIPATFSVTNTLSGFDVLVGSSFLQPCYSVFLKAGALVESNNVTFEGEFSPVVTPSVFTTNIFRFKDTRTGVLPEVKIGGSYIFNDNWSLTVAYTRAFGSTVRTIATFDPVTTFIHL